MVRKKRIAKNIQKSQEDIYVGIDNSNQIRVNVLESIRDLIGVLKSVEKINLLRQKKADTVSLAEIKLNDLKKIIRRLQTLIPAYKISSLSIKKKVEVPRTKKIERIKKKEKTETKKLSEIERLEKELRDIENILSKLK